GDEWRARQPHTRKHGRSAHRERDDSRGGDAALVPGDGRVQGPDHPVAPGGIGRADVLGEPRGSRTASRVATAVPRPHDGGGGRRGPRDGRLRAHLRRRRAAANRVRDLTDATRTWRDGYADKLNVTGTRAESCGHRPFVTSV